MVKILLTAIVALFIVISPASAGIWGEGVTFNDLNDQRTFSSPDYNPHSSHGGLIEDTGLISLLLSGKLPRI